jgi:hypothetical protein
VVDAELRNDLTGGNEPGYPAGVMKRTVTNPPVEEHQVTAMSHGSSWNASFYYWFTNPPALLAGRVG